MTVELDGASPLATASSSRGPSTAMGPLLQDRAGIDQDRHGARKPRRLDLAGEPAQSGQAQLAGLKQKYGNARRT